MYVYKRVHFHDGLPKGTWTSGRAEEHMQNQWPGSFLLCRAWLVVRTMYFATTVQFTTYRLAWREIAGMRHARRLAAVGAHIVYCNHCSFRHGRAKDTPVGAARATQVTSPLNRSSNPSRLGSTFRRSGRCARDAVGGRGGRNDGRRCRGEYRRGRGRRRRCGWDREAHGGGAVRPDQP